ncbi:MAG: hypothetical protein HY774_20435 [Acidobacteria bacterium]|nr:hypothetical protein [Acidobacteriota bacterium]
MSNIPKQFLVDENQNPIAVVIPIEEFQRIEAVLVKSEADVSTESTPSDGPKRATWPDEQRWIKEHQAQYAGQWVALLGYQLLAHGVDAKAVYESAQRQGVENPLFTKIEPVRGFQYGMMR